LNVATTRIAIDPFVSRPSLRHVVGARLEPDARELDARFGTRLDAIACGHSHYDHLMDAPRLARATGAKLVGSRSTCAFGRAAGLPEDQLVEIPAHGGEARIGDLAIRFVPSRHGKIALGRVPFPGEVVAVDRLPARVHEYKMGGAFGLHVRQIGAGEGAASDDGPSVYHNGSADLVDAEIASLRADVILVGLAGRRATPDYVARLVSVLRPRVIVPTHHDAFFAPLDRGVHLLPGVDLDGFVGEARRLAPSARLVTPDYFEALAIPAGSPQDAALLD